MKISIIRSAVIDAPMERVWAVLRDFSSHDRWHPAVARCSMENDAAGDVVGGVRRLSLADGTELREQLLRHSDRERTLTSCILDSPLPLMDYVATMRFKPVTDGDQTFWDWRAQFQAPDNRAAELKDFVGRQIYETGFTGLRAFLAAPAARAAMPAPEAETVETAAADSELLACQAVVAAAFGGPEVLSLREVTVPVPGPRQVRIRQTAVAVNYRDIEQRRGISAGLDLPGTPGMEGVGEIIDVGGQVNGLFPGDRVAYMTRAPGAYAGVRCVDAEACILLPEGVSDIQASSLLKGVTAGLLLGRVFRAASGATILIQSTAGGIGHLLSQWAKSMDLTVIGTASTAEKAKFSRSRGCDHPIVLADDTSLADEVMRITNGRGVDYWVNTGGAPGFENTLACLARGGHCAVIGNRDGQSIPLDVQALMQRSLSVSAPVCFDYLADRSYRQRLSHQLFAKIQSRTIIPAIEAFPLHRAAEAHRLLESRLNMGAVALLP
jgi:NADPH:quinone reductase-like Zn-dependent oxidoreductase/uncharacterized protein YndB with AHSA1/START domain